MEDKEFFDFLYAGWTKTTGAGDRFWMPEEDTDFPTMFSIIAVGEDGSRSPLAAFLSEADAAFITAVHGALPDLVRKLIDLLDENERLDYEKDELIGIHAQLERENAELESKIRRLEGN